MASNINRRCVTDAPQLSCAPLTVGHHRSDTFPLNRAALQQSPPSQFTSSNFGPKSDEPCSALPDELQALIDLGHDPSCLLTAIEVASIFRVSERWVRDHTTRRSPRIRAVYLGPLVRYRLSDIAEFLNDRTAEPCSKETKPNRVRKAA